MTGTYKMRSNDTARFQSITASLAKSGLAFESEDNGEWLTIRACGTPKAQPKRASIPRVEIVPAALTSGQCKKQLDGTTKKLSDTYLHLRKTIHYQWAGYSYWAESHEYATARATARKHHRRIGRAIARIIARHGGSRDPYSITRQDYADLDAAVRHKVRRAGQVPDRYDSYLHYIVSSECGCQSWKRERTGDTSEPADVPDDSRARETHAERIAELKADIEYWTEMERLALLREKPKPAPVPMRPIAASGQVW